MISSAISAFSRINTYLANRSEYEVVATNAVVNASFSALGWYAWTKYWKKLPAPYPRENAVYGVAQAIIQTLINYIGNRCIRGTNSARKIEILDKPPTDKIIYNLPYSLVHKVKNGVNLTLIDMMINSRDVYEFIQDNKLRDSSSQEIYGYICVLRYISAGVRYRFSRGDAESLNTLQDSFWEENDWSLEEVKDCIDTVQGDALKDRILKSLKKKKENGTLFPFQLQMELLPLVRKVYEDTTRWVEDLSAPALMKVKNSTLNYTEEEVVAIKKRCEREPWLELAEVCMLLFDAFVVSYLSYKVAEKLGNRHVTWATANLNHVLPSLLIQMPQLLESKPFFPELFSYREPADN